MKSLCVGSLGISRAGNLFALVLALLWAGNLRANPAPQGLDAEEQTPVKLKLDRQILESDLAAGSLQFHGLPANNGNGRNGGMKDSHPGAPAIAKNASGDSEGGQLGVSFYPADVSYQGGTVLATAESHAIYVDCSAGCFGHPTKFLKKLGDSSFIHVIDEFVGTNASHRYTVGESGAIQYPVSGSLGPFDIVTLVYASAQAFGSGYGHVHHIFFAPGIDVCSDQALTHCYSPDNFNTFYFCAFHGSVTFKDIGHVLFSVEPFQNVPGCQVGQPSPNGPVVDSQMSVLSHELFEAITDPDGTAWWNTYSLRLGGEEIGDECQNFSFVYQTPSISGTLYELQPEYSNLAHACTYSPPN